MKTNHILTAAAMLLAATTAATAQEAARSAYFLDGYSFRHELNPAFSGENNYVSVPGLGNLDASLMSNVGVNTFLYKQPGTDKLTTFMSPTVGANQFLNKLQDNNRITSNVNVTVLSAGFKAFNGYNTISVSARADVGVSLPKGLFEFMKLGQQGESSTYDFSDLRVDANAVAQIALGHSRKIKNNIEVGGKLKFLLGLGHADAKVDNMHVTLADDQWVVRANGTANIAAGPYLRIPTYGRGHKAERPGQVGQVYWDGVDYDNFHMTGFGMAVDLGAVWHTPVDGLTVSGSVLDLGYMHWSWNRVLKTPDTEWTFDGFYDIALDKDQPGYAENKIDKQFNRMFDDLTDCINFYDKTTDGKRNLALAATIHLGAEYQMPFYKKLTGGFLFTQRIDGPFSWTEGRLSANYKPAKWFDCTINYGQSTYASSFGWMVNFHPRGFNFFLGSDHQFFKITPQVLPVGRANMNLNLGMNVTF